jgi:hypothetical protein
MLIVVCLLLNTIIIRVEQKIQKIRENQENQKKNNRKNRTVKKNRLKF